jgi:hypothetical protein
LLTAVQTDICAKAVAWIATTEHLFDFSDLISANLIRVNLLIPHPIILILDDLFETDFLPLVGWQFHLTRLLDLYRYVKSWLLGF